MMSARLETLKQSLRKIAPTALVVTESVTEGRERGGRPTGLADLDRALGGGLPLGTITEIAGSASSGKTAVALTCVAAITGDLGPKSKDGAQKSGRLLCALIDGRAEFYPPAAAALGVDLTRLLWVRPGRGIAAIARAAEILIRARSFALLIIDLPRGAKLTRSVAQRLRTSASQTNTSLIVLCERAGDVEQAHTRLQASQHRGETSLLIHKGSAQGGHESVTTSFDRRRPIAAPAAPVAAAIDRIAPGNEPPGAQIPAPPIFPAAAPVHRQRVMSAVMSTQGHHQAVQGAI